MSNIYVDTSDLEKLMKKFDGFPDQVRSSLNNTLNRTINRVKTNTQKEVKKEYAVNRSIKKVMYDKRSKLSTLTAEVGVTDTRIKMGDFKFSAAQNSQRSPITVTIKKSNGAVTSTAQPPLFMGKNQIYHRTPNDPKYKVGWAFTLSIPQMVSNEEVYQRIADDAHDFMLKRFEQDITYRIKNMK